MKRTQSTEMQRAIVQTARNQKRLTAYQANQTRYRVETVPLAEFIAEINTKKSYLLKKQAG